MMRAVILNCTLKPSPETSSTEALAKVVIAELEKAQSNGNGHSNGNGKKAESRQYEIAECIVCGKEIDSRRKGRKYFTTKCQNKKYRDEKKQT